MRKKGLDFFLVLALALQACESESPDLGSSGETAIRPNLTSVTKTRSDMENSLGKRISTISLSENPDDSLYLVIYEKDMPDSFIERIETKGTEVTTETLDSFKMKAFAENDWKDETGAGREAGEYFSTTGVYKTNGKWQMATRRNWLNIVPVTFWSWNEVEPSVSFMDGSDKASFSYTIPDNVIEQKDLLFAYNRESRTFDSGKVTAMTSSNKDYNRTDEEMDINFCHALSAIKFDISGVVDQNVDRIEIGGVASSGDCRVTVEEGNPAFAWSGYGEAKSYSQNYNPTDFKENGQMVDGSNKEFLMIPQTLTDAATLTITFDGIASKPKCIKGNDVTWQPGKFYTYKITKSAYEYDYKFSLSWDKFIFSNNKDQEGTANPELIYSYRVRSDDPAQKREHVDWSIKSYRIGDGEDVDLGSLSMDYGPTWINANTRILGASVDVLTIKARKADIIAKGKNDYWLNKDGRTEDLGWSPEDWSVKGTIDLSKMNVYDDNPATSINAHAMTTSNCYIVRHTGTYMLPLVYGNGVKGGLENINAYFTQIRSGKDVNKLSRFLNHRDEGITSAFIENNKGCTASRCELLWESDAAVISNLELIGNAAPSGTVVTVNNVRYLKFTVDKNTVEQSNALIAIKDSEGNVIWNWHIWVTNDPNVTAQPIEVTNYNGNKYYFLNVDNIGAVTESYYLERPDIVLTLQQERPSGSPATLKITLKQAMFNTKRSSLMFEWGRKDPFLKNDVDHAGNPILTYKQENSTIGSGIREPLTWFGFTKINNVTREWIDPVYTNLWTGIKGNYNILERDSETIKTIYDPSPVGYMVPPIGAFSGFDTRIGKHPDNPSQPECWNVVSTVFNDGYEFYTSLGPGHTVNTTGPTIRFHADGIRAGNGSMHMEDRGWYMSSTFDSDLKAAIFTLQDKECSSYGTASPSNGCSIRPIRED